MSSDHKLIGELVDSGDELVRMLRLVLNTPYDHRNKAEAAIRSWQSPKVVAITRIKRQS